MANIKFNTYEPKEEKKGDTEVKLTVGVFFDGTLNNRKNVRARKIANGEKQEIEQHEIEQDYIDAFNNHGTEGSSYFDDESNVSRLESCYLDIETQKENTFKVYVEGIGTKDLEGDKWYSTATGKSDTEGAGVIAKVKNACAAIVEKVERSAVKDENGDSVIHSLTFDCYGFSRGAAAARHFIYQVKRSAYSEDFYDLEKKHNNPNPRPAYGYLGEELAKVKVKVKKIIIRFVGLYDTVASYGIWHEKDVEQLKLNHLYHAEKVVQLTAQDEVRKKFKLTNINSANNKGITISLPGVHSDIGGGYSETLTEENLLIDESGDSLIYKKGFSWSDFLDRSNPMCYFKPGVGYVKRERYNSDSSQAKGIEDAIGISLLCYYYNIEGWYKFVEFKKSLVLLKLRAERKGLTNAYSVIPLQIMAKFSEENNASIDMMRLNEDFNTNDPNHSFLNLIQGRIEEEIAAKKGRRTIDCLLFNREKNLEENWNNKKNSWKWRFEGNSYRYDAHALRSATDVLEGDCEHLKLLCECFGFNRLRSRIEKDFKVIKREYEEFTKSLSEGTQEDQSNEEKIVCLSEVIVEADMKSVKNNEALIRELRNKYLHVSHTYENKAWILEPHKPNENYKREILNG